MYVLFFPFRRFLEAENIVIGGAIVYAITFVAKWSIVWLVQWWLFPAWLVESRSGIQTMLQVLPATIFALFVAIMGAIFIVAQQAMTAYGTRAAMSLTTDSHVIGLILRPLLVLIPALLLAGQVPDTGGPSHFLTAGVATIALATVSIILVSAVLLPGMLVQYTAPVSFANKTVAHVEDFLAIGAPGMVVYRVRLLGEMLRTSLRRGDSTSFGAALNGLRQFQEAYIAAARQNPDARIHTYDDGETSEGWLGQHLREVLVRAGHDAIQLDAAELDLDQIGLALRHAAVRFLEADLVTEAKELTIGLLELGVSSAQVRGTGLINIFAKSVEGLVVVERTAEEPGEHELATLALAAWLVVISYAQTHFGMEEHPHWRVGLGELGPEPPFNDAANLILSEEFQRRWLNKMPQGPVPVIGVLAMSQQAYAHGFESLEEWLKEEGGPGHAPPPPREA